MRMSAARLRAMKPHETGVTSAATRSKIKPAGTFLTFNQAAQASFVMRYRPTSETGCVRFWHGPGVNCGADRRVTHANYESASILSANVLNTSCVISRP
jgi:hypothetical protein